MKGEINNLDVRNNDIHWLGKNKYVIQGLYIF